VVEQRTIEQRLAARGWFTTKVKPPKRGMYRTTRMDLVESNNAGGAYSTWDGKKWGPAKSESGTFWGDYSTCSNMLWAKPNTPFVTLKEISGAVDSAAANDVHRGKTFVTEVPEPPRPDAEIRDLDAAGVPRHSDIPEAAPVRDALQPEQQAVRKANVIVSDYLTALLLTGLYGSSLDEVEDRLICQGIERAIRHRVIPRRKPAGASYPRDDNP